MRFGQRLGCHQMPERSIFINGYQFPVCARCMGVIPASFISMIIFFWYKVSIPVSLGLCAIMFLDWLLQRMSILPSTNVRRFITGVLGGYGFMTLQMYVYWNVCILLKRIIF